MKLFLSYLAAYRPMIALSLLAGAVAQVFYMLEPHFLGILIDHFARYPHEVGYYNDQSAFISQGVRSQPAFLWGVLKYLGLILAVGIVANLSKIFQDYFIKAITEKCANDIYTDGLRRCMKLPYEKFEDRSSGEIVSILESARSNVQSFLTSVLDVLYSTLVAVMFVIIYCFSLHWSIMLIYVAVVMVLMLVSSFLTLKLRSMERNIGAQVAAFSGAASESLLNVQIIKSLGLTEQQVRKNNSTAQNILALQLKLVKRIRIMTALNGAFINFLRLVITATLLFFIFNRELTTGKLITLSFYSVFILYPFYGLGNVVFLYRSAEAALLNLNDLIHDIPAGNDTNAIKIDHISQLEFADVHFTHQNASYPSLSGVSFKITSGQTIALVGPSGSGKTTLVRLLLGLYRPQSGKILYNGIRSDEINFDALRSRISLITQDTQLFGGTIKENMLFVNPMATDAQIRNSILESGGAELLQRCRNGIDTVIGEGGIKLSGGEKQQLSIARALLRDPQLVIFDEATSSLDSIKEEEIMEGIRSVSANKKFLSVLIAHRLSTVFHADMIYVLENGYIVESGVHESLLALKGLYYSMWRQQVGERSCSFPA